MSKHRKGALVVLIVLVGTVALSMGSGPDGKKKRRTAYEYASIDLVTIGEDSRAYFTDAGGTRTKAANFADLSKKLGIKRDDGLLALLNHFGGEGWQFIQVEDSMIQGGSVRSYYLKRTVR